MLFELDGISNSEEILNEFNKKCEEARSYLSKSFKSDDYKSLLINAVNIYSEASEISPSSSEPYLAIADICWQFGQPDYAKGLLNKLLVFEPENLFALNMLNAIENEPVSTSKSNLLKKIKSDEKPTGDFIDVKAFNFDISQKSKNKEKLL